MLGGLADRLGMRRSPSGLDTSGALRLPPEPVRVVSPVPPHEPEPHEPEPFAPVYDYVPLLHDFVVRDRPAWVLDPRGPDPVVFGPDYPHGDPGCDFRVYCRCGVAWAMGTAAECWNCGRPG